MQFYFPPITNSNSRRKTGVFCSFVSQTSQRSGIIHSQTLVMNFYSLQLLSKNYGLTDLDLKGAVKTKHSSLYLRITSKRVETTAR